MNGIQGLMGNQGPMPGQASQQPMPGMMPQQGAPTPQAMTSQLKNMPLEQLRMFLMNPQPNSPPLWAVISAVAEKQKEAQAMQAAQGQQVMAQNQQMQQQPPVAAQVMQAAEQTPEPVMAAYGGEMHGYAGGGAVAFGQGGNVQHFRNGADEFGLMANPEAEAMDALRVERAQKEKQLKALEETYYALRMQNDPRAEQVKQQLDVISGRVSAPQNTPQQIPPTSAFAKPAYVAPENAAAPIPGSGQRRQPAVQKPPATGIGALAEQPPTPAVDAYAAASAAQQEAMRRAGQVTPEEVAARQGIDKLLATSASSFEEERKRREAVAQQRMQEAQSRFDRPGLQDMAGIGRLLAGMAGAKTLYGGLTGAGAAAGKYQEDKEAALRAAQEKFDLSGKEMFELSRLQQQVQMDQAKLTEARASGDAQRSVKAALDVANSQKELAQYQTELGMKREKMALDTRDVESRRISAEAARTQAGKPTAQEFAYALFKSNPEKYKEFLAAGQEPKSEGAMLKEIVSAALKNPLMLQQYPPAIQALVNQELLKLGVTSALPKGAPVRE